MTDPNAENRKKDHISLAFDSQMDTLQKDSRFYYEPMLAAHPQAMDLSKPFLGKTIRLPLWVSSMTGGTAMAGKINRNLAQVCAEFGMGMGLGSCRSLLHSRQHFADFNMRPVIGNALPFYANLGIAQVEKLIAEKNTGLMDELVNDLQADGLIIHINPLQEWLQPEGDRIEKPPVETISNILQLSKTPIIVKEVGQGFGPASIMALLQMPLAAIEFGAWGGTNFSKLELLRSTPQQAEAYSVIAPVGHSVSEMVEFVNQALLTLGDKVKCTEIIVSGGINSFIDGYYHMEKLQLNSVYAQASALLRYAREDMEQLRQYVKTQADGLALCKQYLTLRK